MICDPLFICLGWRLEQDVIELLDWTPLSWFLHGSHPQPHTPAIFVVPIPTLWIMVMWFSQLPRIANLL